MPKSSDFSELAASLATVAITALVGGPRAAGGAALTRVVTFARSRYDAHTQTRDLRRQLSSDIERLAEAERLATHAVRLGLDLAAKTVDGCGLDIKAIAKLEFDATAVAQQVIKAAMARDQLWGTEDHYAVAERAIVTTYAVLIKQFTNTADSQTLLAVLSALRTDIDEQMGVVLASLEEHSVALEGLSAASVAEATVADLMKYLRVRIADWDQSDWLPSRRFPSVLERRLQVHSTDAGESARSGELLSAEEALAGQRMLVVLGGPGSGKTWLARRYAREAALTALSLLEAGKGADEVEVPLFTTWELWTKAGLRDTRQRLVAASFASGLGHSDLGGKDINDRLERTFTSADSRILAIVDSLDEAADKQNQDGELREITTVSGWRLVITSRPGAGEKLRKGDDNPQGGDRPQVVELVDLSYPDDVRSFIETWFAERPGIGTELWRQIERRPELRRSVVIPLLLTFYCILSEDPQAIGKGLPARRRELYQSLVQELLVGEWAPHAPGPDAEPDLAYCESLLANWALDAVKDRNTPAGLGRWGDRFVPATRPRPDAARAIDHIAPKVEVNRRQLTRRFVHRTIMEHFVAEQIATLSADEAAEILLPHLWFDQDWEVAAPAAIAEHHRRQPGALLQKLLEHADHPAGDLARQVARKKLAGLLAAFAVESDARSWSAGQPNLSQLRDQILVVLLDALPDGDPWSVPPLVEGLVALELTPEERAEARRVLLASLPDGHPWYVAVLATGLVALKPTPEERVEARRALRAVLRRSDPWSVAGLVEGLVALEPTPEERAEARRALLAALPYGDPWSVAGLMESLVALKPTPEERAQARRVVGTITHRAEARRVLPTGVRDGNPLSGAGLARRLLALKLTPEERAAARRALLGVLRDGSPLSAGGLARSLLALKLTPEERAETRRALRAVLRGSGPWSGTDLVEGLLALKPTPEEGAEARKALLAVLPDSGPGSATGLVEGLVALKPTPEERAEARKALLAVLPDSGPGSISRLMSWLVALEPTPEERAEVLQVLPTALPDGDPEFVAGLVEGLVALELTPEERAEARQALLAVLPYSDPESRASLVQAIRSLSSIESWLAWLAEAPNQA